MKSLIGLLAALVLTLVAVVPAGAQSTVPLHGPCNKPGTKVGVGPVDGTIATPMVPTMETTATFLVDLEGQPTTKRANVTVDLTWGDVTDFDLDVNGTVSGAFNPVTGVGAESAALSNLAHCSTVTVTVTNFAGNPAAAMALKFTTTLR